jgi:hypothetical protein
LENNEFIFTELFPKGFEEGGQPGRGSFIAERIEIIKINTDSIEIVHTDKLSNVNGLINRTCVFLTYRPFKAIGIKEYS